MRRTRKNTMLLKKSLNTRIKSNTAKYNQIKNRQLKNTLGISTLAISVILPIVSHSADIPTTPSIETISIVSSKINQPLGEMATSVTVLTEQDLRAFGQISLADALRAVTSVGVSNSGGVGKNTTLRIRGEEGFRTLILIDGVELSDPSAPQVLPIFDDILTSQIERVEILRGPQGLLYGADAGGVIRITSSTAQPGITGGIQTQFGKFNTEQLGANVGYANDNSNLYFAATRLETDGYNAQKTDTSNENDGYENQTLHFKGETALTDNLKASLVIRDVDSEVEYDGCFDSATFATIHACTSKTDQQTARALLSYTTTGQNHQLGYSQTDVSRDFFAKGTFGFSQSGEIEKLDYLAQFELGKQRLIAGFEIEEESNQTISRKQRSLFTEYQYQYLKHWSTTAGIRFDDNDTFGNHTSYRLGSAYLIENSLPGTLKLKGSYGTGFRAPSLFEQSYNDGDFAFGDAKDLQLKEETSRGYDIGLEWFLKDTFVALTRFNQRIQDEIIFDASGFQGYLQTLGTSRSKGYELEWHHLPASNIKLWGNYTYNDSESSTGDPRLRRPKHLSNIGIILANTTNTLSFNTHVHWEKDSVDIGNTPLDDYATVNISAQYQLNSTLLLTAKIDNLLNREYEQVKGFNSAARAGYVGMEWQF